MPEMIALEVDVRKLLRDIEKKLDKMKSEAPGILEKSLNAAGRKAKKLIAQKADETYNAPENASQIQKAERMKKAQPTSLTAYIKANTPTHALSKFPFTFLGDDLAAAIKANKDYKVVHPEKLSPKSASKPFFVTFRSSGHQAVVYRTTKKRYPIQEIRTVPLAFMIGNRESFEEIKPEIEAEIQAQIKKQLSKILV